MRLVLKVLMSPEGCGLEGQAQMFEESGGSFGRGPANQWILPDPSRHISSVHGKVAFSSGQFFLGDESTNGVYLNDEEFPIGQGNQVPISNGDQIAFGEYILEVELDSQPELSADTMAPVFDSNAPTPVPPSKSDSFDDLDKWLDPMSSEPPIASSAQAPIASNSFSTGKLDDDLMGGNAGAPPQDPLAALDGAGGGNNLATPKPSNPADFSLDDLLGSPASPQSAPAPSARHESMDLNRILEPTPATPPKPEQTPPGASSFDKTMVHTTDSSEPQQSSPSLDALELNATPQTKNEDTLADELDSFLSGASLKSEPPKQAPVTPAVKTPPPQDDLLGDDLDDFLSPSPPNAVPDAVAKITPKKTPDSKPSPISAKPASTKPQTEKPAPQESDSAMPDTEAAKTTEPKPVAPKSPLKNTPTAPATEAEAPQKPATKSETAPAPAPAPAPNDRPQSSTENEYRAAANSNTELAEKLGLSEIPASSQALLTDTVASVIEETVKGLMMNLRARNQVKSEFRLNMTMIQAAENNPLKFSVTVEDALENMFAKRGKAYMPPLEAVQDSFADIGDHQVALFDAMRAAYDHMLSQFDPESIESNGPATKSRKFLGGRKDEHWEQYKAFYQQLQADRELTFKRSFGEVFAESYEKRMQELKITRIRNEQP